MPACILHSTSKGQHPPLALKSCVFPVPRHLPPGHQMRLPAGTDLGEVELQGVIGGEGDHETTRQVLRKGVAVVAEEEAVVAEWRHGNANLGQVVQILQDRSLG